MRKLKLIKTGIRRMRGGGNLLKEKMAAVRSFFCIIQISYYELTEEKFHPFLLIADAVEL
jgi:hypothetical protein